MDTSSIAEFKNSLNDTINDSTIKFKEKYGYLFGKRIKKIRIKEDNSISSFTSLCDFISNSNFRGKVSLYLI